MRFAYIDSQGKEVGIPSVEALGLRIELGAITPSTQLYDSTADRWAPAAEHEVFRTLSREIQEKGEGFVAPPPQSRPPATQPGSAAPKAGEAADETPPPESAKPRAPSSDDAAPAPSAPPSPDAPERRRAPNPFEMLDGQTEEAPEPPAAAAGDAGGTAEDAAAAEDGADPLDMGFDLTLTPPEEEDVSGPPEAEPASAPGVEESGGFDMGDMEALEVEGSSVVEEDEGASAVVSDGGLELEDMLSASYGGADEDTPAGPGEGRGAVSLWDDEGGADDEDEGSSWAMEAPAEAGDESEEEGEARRRADVERRRAAARARFGDDEDGETAGVAPPAGEKRPARSAPSSRPRSKPASSGLPAGAVWGILLLVVAGAGWFGWSLFQDRRAAVAAAADNEPPVPIPQIPADLQPRYRELADAALQATLAELRALAEEQALAPAPPARWLSGAYMANASDFSQVDAYLDGLRGYLDAVRAADSLAFNAAFAAALEASGEGEAPSEEGEEEADGARAAVDEGEADLLRRRAAAGFSAAGRDRRRAYADFENVLRAAGSLHAFLLENEDQIEYAPASGGMSVDPVLEAVPASRALGNEMWDRVDDITEALDALGALDQVTTDRLVAVLLRRVEAAGVR